MGQVSGRIMEPVGGHTTVGLGADSAGKMSWCFTRTTGTKIQRFNLVL